MELLEKVDMLLTLSNVSKFPILLNSFISFEMLGKQINSSLSFTKNVQAKIKTNIIKSISQFSPISKKARKLNNLKEILKNYKMIRDYKYISQNLNDIKIDNYDKIPKKLKNITNFIYNKKCTIHLIIKNKLEKLKISSIFRLKDINLETLCLVIYSPFDKKYVKFEKKSIIYKISKTFDFITKAENHNYEEIAIKFVNLYKKYNDNMKENINDKITEKNILESFFYFIKINLKIFSNLQFFFISCFNILIDLNRNQLCSVLKEKPYEIFIKNTSILINNLIKEFFLHIKEFYEEIRPSLMNEFLLKIFLDVHNSIIDILFKLFDTQFLPGIHFLYLPKYFEKKIIVLFENAKKRINIGKGKELLEKIEMKMMEEICLKKSQNFQNSLNSVFLENSLIIREKFKIKNFLKEILIPENNYNDIIFETNSFLLLILKIFEYKILLEISSEFIKIIGEYILLSIEEYIILLEKTIETENSIENLSLILEQISLLKEIIKKLILDKVLKNFEDYSLIQKNLKKVFDCIKIKIMDFYDDLVNLEIDRYFLFIRNLDFTKNDFLTPSLEIRDLIFRINKQSSFIFNYLEEHFRYNKDNLVKNIRKINDFLGECKKKQFSNSLLLQNEIDFLKNLEL